MTAILNASGCLDALTAPEIARSLDAYVTKTVTPLPREGNAPIRIAETEGGLLNSIGLPNPGIDRFLAESLPALLGIGVPLWVSVGGFCAEDYALVCSALDKYEGVAVLELNLSCPNVEAASESVSELVAAAREVTGKPLYAKLSPSVPDIASTACAARAAGADGLSLVNTVRGLVLDPQTLRPRLATATGGLSGSLLRPIALAAVYESHRACGLPIVGMGGVSCGRDALELLAAGASAVAVGTILFADPGAPARIRGELTAALAALGVDSADDISALAHGDAVLSPSTLNGRSMV